jgi:hypothetical protein
MATANQMERLVGKALFDSEFRYQLIADPGTAARSAGIFLSEEQAARVRGLNVEELEALAEKFRKMVGPKNAIRYW